MAHSYDTAAFAEKMDFVIENPELAKKICQNGKELGLREFSHLKYGPILRNFLQEI